MNGQASSLPTNLLNTDQVSPALVGPSITAPSSSPTELLSSGSGPAQDHDLPIVPSSSPGSISTRAKTGCITCRLRKKRCDEGKPRCAACDRLGIQCLGYGAKRPKWLRDEQNAKKAKLEIKEKVSMRRTNRSKQKHRDSSEDQQIGGLSETWEPEKQHSSTATAGSIWEIGSEDARGWGIPDQNSNESTSLAPFNNFDSSVLGGNPTSPFEFTHDPELEDVWKILFGQTNPFPSDSLAPLTSAHNTSVFPIPTPTAGPSTSLPNQGYLHHYLNVVLPLQYRFAGSLSIGELVAPLAMARNEVLTSVSSLAALHLSVKRNKVIEPSAFLSTLTGSPATNSNYDEDALIAISAHQESIERLRFISSTDFTAEDIILSAMFAVSYHTFTGGTSKGWREILAVSQRCLSAALASSPELTGSRPSYSMQSSPWQKYRQLIEVMIWMDIIASVSQNKGTRLLSTYRTILGHLPMMSPTSPRICMERVMGGDSTTLLAIAETVALSEWCERSEEAGCLSPEVVRQRALPIEKLLNERAWRESHFDESHTPLIGLDGSLLMDNDDSARLRVMSDVFYGAAQLFLASVVYGPYPRIPEIAAAVQDIIEALHRLDIILPNPDINRALVFPITLAGCHCETPSQQAFFRGRFGHLDSEASAFGNTRPAKELMEEVWRRRSIGGRGMKVCWREVMKEMGWEAGILLI